MPAELPINTILSDSAVFSTDYGIFGLSGTNNPYTPFNKYEGAVMLVSAATNISGNHAVVVTIANTASFNSRTISLYSGTFTVAAAALSLAATTVSGTGVTTTAVKGTAGSIVFTGNDGYGNVISFVGTETTT